MIGSIIGAGLKVAGAISGGIGGVVAANKKEKELAKKESANNEFYNEEMSKDYTQRAESQNAVNKMRDAFMERQKTAAASSAVSGGSAESEALMKEQSSAAMADTMGDLAVASESQKEAAAKEYRERQDAINSERVANAEAKRQAIATAAGSVLDAGTGIASSFMEGGNKSNKPDPSSMRSQGVQAVSSAIGDVGRSAKQVASEIGSPVSVDMGKYQPSIIEENIEPDVFGLRHKAFQGVEAWRK